MAALSPVEGDRKVLVLPDFHLVRDAGPTLLKALEEPPPSTVFVVLADDVPPELVTIASRCVRVPFRPLPPDVVEQALLDAGVSAEVATLSTEVAGGDLRRARLLAADPGLTARVELWRTAPDRLDGSGRQVVEVADELRAALSAASAPLAEAHREELAALETRVAETGERGAGRKALEARHRREVRRLREDELRAGLAVLAGRYAGAAVSAPDPAPLVAAVDTITELGERLVHNPSEELQLWDLLWGLPPVPR
jgi:DNA polymerase-3 subunit delta'